MHLAPGPRKSRDSRIKSWICKGFCAGLQMGLYTSLRPQWLWALASIDLKRKRMSWLLKAALSLKSSPRLEHGQRWASGISCLGVELVLGVLKLKSKLSTRLLALRRNSSAVSCCSSSLQQGSSPCKLRDSREARGAYPTR